MTDQAPELVEPSAPEQTSSKKSKVSPATIAVGVGGVILGILITLAAQGIGGALATDDRLSAAVEECGESDGVTLADENSTLIVDTKGEDDASGASYLSLSCLLSALDAPSSVVSHLGQTTSMDGRQSASWEGITMQWSYHPDRGADAVITIDEK